MLGKRPQKDYQQFKKTEIFPYAFSRFIATFIFSFNFYVNGALVPAKHHRGASKLWATAQSTKHSAFLGWSNALGDREKIQHFAREDLC